MTKTFSQKQTKETKSGLYLSLFVLFVAFCSILYAADLKIPNVTVTVSDFTLDYAPDGKTVTLMPASGGSTFSGTSDADGVVNFLRVTPGQYTLSISGIGLDPLTLQVPNSTNDLSASNLVVSAWTPPSGAPYAGATANLRAWSLLPTSAKQDVIWASDGTFIYEQESIPVRVKYDVYATNELTYGLRVTVSAAEGLTNSAGYSGVTVANNIPGLLTTEGATYYGGNGNFGISAETGSSSSGLTNSAIVVSAYAGGREGLAIGVLAESDPSVNSQTNIALVANVVDEGKSGPMIAGYFELGSDGNTDPALATSAVLLLDNRARPDLPLIVARTNNGTTVFSVAGSGLASSVAGFGSTDTTAAVNITATGWTNTFGKNAVVYYDGTAVTAIVKNNAGTAVYTNAAALTGMSSILLQPSGAVILSGTGVKGRATPF